MDTKTKTWGQAAIEIEEAAKQIPLTEFTVGELPEVIRINASGLRVDRNGEELDMQRMEWWEKKIEAWKEKVAREGEGHTS